MNRLHEKIKKHEVAFGTHISLNDSTITELIGNVGFDYLWIDMEHTAINLDTLQLHLIAARAAGVSAIVRIPWNDFIYAKPVLEMGPQGIVFPHINTYNEAIKVVQACSYPPKGIRGFGPRRAIQYGKISIEEYLSKIDDELLKIIQIEDIEAVKNLDHILTIEDIDVFILGPCDLASSLGKIGQWQDPKVLNTIKTVFKKIKEAGKTVGVSYGAASYEEILGWNKLGADMISIAADTDLLFLGAKGLLKKMKKAFGIISEKKV